MTPNGPDLGAQPLAITCTGKQGPIPEGSAITPCPACLLPLLPGQYFTQIPLGCGGDPKKRALARRKLPFGIVSVAIHWACVTGDESESNLSLV